MTRLVVDASVAVTWFIREVHAAAALRVLDGARDLYAPELMWAEFANVLWKKVRRGEISVADGGAILLEVLRFPVRTVPMRNLVVPTLGVATELGRSLDDSC